MKRACMDRLKVMEKQAKDNTVRIPKIGEMATFLAKDIVDMVVSKEKKNKITSFYYDKMQECLALYSDPEKKALFIHIVSKELKLYEEGGHPFLKKVNLQTISRTSDLYVAYLKEKGNKLVSSRNYDTEKTSQVDQSWMMTKFYVLEWNEEAKKKLTMVKYPSVDTDIPYTIKQWNKSTDKNLETWLNYVTKGKTDEKKQDKKKPIDLPTNLFDEAICKLLREKLNECKTTYNDTANYNELLKLWWTSRGDTVQPFYQAKREYEIYEEKVRFDLKPQGKFDDYYQSAFETAFIKKKTEREKEREKNRKLPPIQKNDIERVFKNTIAGTEKEIRILQEEDRILLLILEKLMEDAKNLTLSNAKQLLNEIKEVKQVVEGRLHFNNLGEEGKSSITRTIVAKRKQKHYTVLRKYLYDRRMPELFEYTPENENISLDWLENELKAYNKAKQEVFDLIFLLEKNIIDADKEGLLRLNVKPEIGNIQHNPYLQWLFNKGFISNEQHQFMRMVRNTFSHNQFPQRDTMEVLIKQWDKRTYSLQIAKEYDAIISALLSKIH